MFKENTNFRYIFDARFRGVFIMTTLLQSLRRQARTLTIPALLLAATPVLAVPATPVSVDFRAPASVNITSAALPTVLGKADVYRYFDPLTVNLGSGLELSISAMAYKKGDLSKPLDRVVYYSTVNSPLQYGLGVTSVSQGSRGNYFDNGRDGSIDIDNYLSADNGQDVLQLTFNRQVTVNSLSLFGFGGDDRASFEVLGGSAAALTLKNNCFGCLEINNYTAAVDLAGTSFLLKAAPSGKPGLIKTASEFRLAGLNVTSVTPVTPPVPEPETYAMMVAGLGLIAGIARRRKQKTA
ncbi:MAG: hypothetical protein RL695_1549 [Pseudomonadota bacterium]